MILKRSYLEVPKMSQYQCFGFQTFNNLIFSVNALAKLLNNFWSSVPTLLLFFRSCIAAISSSFLASATPT